MLFKRRRPGTIDVGTLRPGTTRTISDDCRALRVSDSPISQLLGAIIAQAWHDGMTKVHLGIDGATQTMFLRYYGPSNWESPLWWEMSPPPAERYSALVQTLIANAQFDLGAAPIGHLIIRVNRTDLHVNVTIRGWHDVLIEW